MHRRIASTCLLWGLYFLQYNASHAEQSPIAPLLRDDTWLVARVNVDTLQVHSLYAALDQAVGLPPLPSEQEAEQFVMGFRQAGGKELYLVRGGESAAFCFAPLPPGANAEAIGEALLASPFHRMLTIEATERLAGGVIAGTRATLRHVRSQQAASQPDVDQALEAASGMTLQVVMRPTDDKRKFAEALVWNLFQSNLAETAVDEIEWASIGFDAPPQPRFKIVFQAKDADSLDRLETKLDEFLEPLISHASVRKNLALVENLCRILDWQRAGNTLSLELDDQQGELTVVARGMIQPVLEANLLVGARPRVENQLKQIVVALLNHHDVFKRFPAPAILDGVGKPLLSWRVKILPFIEQHALYKEFHLDEPWDSPHNLTLLARMPDVYRCPLSKAPHDHTVYLTARGKGTVFSGPDGTPIRQIIDGTSKTIGVVEADDEHAVPWSKPDDWSFDPDQPTAGLGGHFPDVFLATGCDGAVHTLKLSIDPEVLRNLLSQAGREPISFPNP